MHQNERRIQYNILDSTLIYHHDLYFLYMNNINFNIIIIKSTRYCNLISVLVLSIIPYFYLFNISKCT